MNREEEIEEVWSEVRKLSNAVAAAEFLSLQRSSLIDKLKRLELTEEELYQRGYESFEELHGFIDIDLMV